MSKDPAILWYWNDWQGGTMTLTRHQKGCYMDLLTAQFNSGPLSLEQIKILLGTDQAVWTVLQAKFKREVNSEGIEVFFNERMESEKIKRRAFSKKQSINGSKGGRKPSLNPTLKPNESLLEDENGIEIRDRGKGKGWNTFPGPESKNLVLPELTVGAVIQLFEITKQTKVIQFQVQGLWNVFKVQNFTGKKFYQDEGDVFSHFINWCKTQDIKKVTQHAEQNQLTSPPLKTNV